MPAIYDPPVNIVAMPRDWASYGDSRAHTIIPVEFTNRFTELLKELQTATGKVYTLELQEPGKRSLEVYSIPERRCQFKVTSKYQHIFNENFIYEELNGTYDSFEEIENQINRFLLRDFLKKNHCEITEGENRIYWRCPACQAYGVKYDHISSYNTLRQHFCVHCEEKRKDYMSNWHHLRVNKDELNITSVGTIIATIELI